MIINNSKLGSRSLHVAIAIIGTLIFRFWILYLPFQAPRYECLSMCPSGLCGTRPRPTCRRSSHFLQLLFLLHFNFSNSAYSAAWCLRICWRKLLGVELSTDPLPPRATNWLHIGLLHIALATSVSKTV